MCDSCESLYSELELIKKRCADYREQTIALKQENNRTSETVANQRKELKLHRTLLDEARGEALNLLLENKNYNTALQILQQKCKAYEEYIDNYTAGKMLCIVQKEEDVQHMLKFEGEKKNGAPVSGAPARGRSKKIK